MKTTFGELCDNALFTFDGWPHVYRKQAHADGVSNAVIVSGWPESVGLGALFNTGDGVRHVP